MRRPYNKCEALPEVAANKASVHKPNLHNVFSDRRRARRAAGDIPPKEHEPNEPHAELRTHACLPRR
jgi:hypothetical protein